MNNNQNKCQFSQPSACDHQSKKKDPFIRPSQIVPSSRGQKTSKGQPSKSNVSSRFPKHENEKYSNYKSQIKNDGSQNDFKNQLLNDMKPNDQGKNQDNTPNEGRKCTFIIDQDEQGQYIFAHNSQKNKTQTKNPQNVSPHITQGDKQHQKMQKEPKSQMGDIPYYNMSNTVKGFMEKNSKIQPSKDISQSQKQIQNQSDFQAPVQYSSQNSKMKVFR